MKYIRWINLFMGIVGVWLIASPFVFGYSTLRAPFLNDLIIGIVVLVVSVVHGYFEFKTPVMKPTTV